MKEQKFEKVVEWDIDKRISSIFFILMIPLLTGGWVSYFHKAFNIFLSILIVYSGLFLLGIIGVISNRKVFWRKIK